MKKLEIIFVLTFLIFIQSCNRTEKLSVRNVNENEIGIEAICPVTKNKFKVSKETKAVDYKGQTYYFCCPGCDSQFIKEPEKYIISSSTYSVQSSTRNEVLYWTCSMHPQVRQDKRGKCPICGMELIPIYKGDENKIVVDKKTAEVLGIKSQPVKKIFLIKTIHLPGKVAYDNDLYLAQQEYLTSFQNLHKVKGLDDTQENRIKETLDAAKYRLMLLGYTEEDIKELEKNSQIDKNLIYPAEKVWIHAEIYEYDLALVRPGLKVVATTPAYPSEKFYGVVRFVEPVLNPQTRSAKARIEVANPQNKLKLEMYVYLELKINLGRQLSIPESALIDTGTRKVVYLDLGDGRYKMQEVKTGLIADGYVQVLGGLKEGDMVVTDGNFLLDSQATLTGGQSLLYGAAEEIKENQK